MNSVFAAQKNLKLEVFVIDNNSVDRSVEMVRRKFPEVKCIHNLNNVGFSKANNQALKLSHGKYVLLLNPDTVIEEDTLIKCFNLMEEKENIGGLGVRMLDGKGNFLPESKRGFPSPRVSFFKMFGFSKFFPKSKLFNKYHLGYLSEFESNEIDVLSGAFMFLRKETLDSIGFLDEDFFMYGEDIDLSYRIQKSGYKNYYFPETKIIHYKGESTKKGSVNYVFIFYKAMITFAKKHFDGNNMKLFISAIYFAIYFRASLSVIRRIYNFIKWPLIDSIIVFIGLIALTNQWKMNDIHFPIEVFKYQIPVYTLTWIISSYIFGVYDRLENINKIWKSWFISTVLILVIYGLLPKNLQFSRLFIIVGSFWFLTQFFLSRIFYILIKENRIGFPRIQSKIFAIIGSKSEFERIKKLIEKSAFKFKDIIHVGVDENSYDSIGNIKSLPELVSAYKLNELIFSAQDVESKLIIDSMIKIPSDKIEFKIAQPHADFLIGSNSIHTSGDLYSLDINKFNEVENRRIKRFFDLSISFTLLVISPVLFFLQHKKKHFFKNLFLVLISKKTFVGTLIPNKFSRLKPSVINAYKITDVSGENDYVQIELLYSKNYTLFFDLQIVLRNLRNIG